VTIFTMPSSRDTPRPGWVGGAKSCCSGHHRRARAVTAGRRAVRKSWLWGNYTARKQVHMTPELDQPFGRRRWDPLADIDALTTTDVTPATGGENPHTAPEPAADATA